MTSFEELAKEMNIEITINGKGLYTGKCEALAIEVNKVILSDDEEIFKMEWEKQKELIKENFYKIFPYMR